MCQELVGEADVFQQTTVVRYSGALTSACREKRMNSKRPEWRIPENLQSLIEADEDLTWETSDWSPILLSVIAGTSYCGRDIPLAWQIEFEPIGSTGYDWSDRIAQAVSDRHPEMIFEPCRFLRGEEVTSMTPHSEAPHVWPLFRLRPC